MKEYPVGVGVLDDPTAKRQFGTVSEKCDAFFGGRRGRRPLQVWIIVPRNDDDFTQAIDQPGRRRHATALRFEAERHKNALPVFREGIAYGVRENYSASSASTASSVMPSICLNRSM